MLISLFVFTHKSGTLFSKTTGLVAREERIELPPTVLETAILPLNYSRKSGASSALASLTPAPIFEISMYYYSITSLI